MDSSSQAVVRHHAPPQGFIRKYLFSVDHKVIGKQYYGLALLAACIGMVLSWLMRIHLGWATAHIPLLEKLSPAGAPGNVVTPEYYLSLMTMHATLMVFFVLTTAPFAGFGNYFLPIQVGAEDMAFPRINMMSFWVTFAAFVVLILSFFIGDGPALAGWTSYAPLSSVGAVAGPGQGTGQTLWALSIAIFCVGQLLGSLNFITTTLGLRTRGLSLARMPLSTWAWFVTSVIGLLAFAVLLPACGLLVLDRVAGTSFFRPAGLVVNGRALPPLLISMPATIVVLLSLGTLYGARMRLPSPALFCVGFISACITRVLSGFFLSQPSLDTYLHATYFVVAHFHFVMAVPAMFGIFAGTYFWFPKMFGRMMNETLGKWHFWLTFVGVYAIFMPMHYLGLAGNVRRYAAFTDNYLAPLIPVHKFITIAALFTGAAQLLFLCNVIWSRFRGPKATDNPWEATTLEWSTSSPPPFDNFGGRHLVVHHGPEEYGVESPSGDYVMQVSPEKVAAS